MFLDNLSLRNALLKAAGCLFKFSHLFKSWKVAWSHCEHNWDVVLIKLQGWQHHDFKDRLFLIVFWLLFDTSRVLSKTFFLNHRRIPFWVFNVFGQETAEWFPVGFYCYFVTFRKKNWKVFKGNPPFFVSALFFWHFETNVSILSSSTFKNLCSSKALEGAPNWGVFGLFQKNLVWNVPPEQIVTNFLLVFQTSMFNLMYSIFCLTETYRSPEKRHDQLDFSLKHQGNEL